MSGTPTWARSRLLRILGAMAFAAAAWVEAGAATGPLDGEWVFYPRHLINDSPSGLAGLASAPDGALFAFNPLKARLGGRWDSLPGDILEPWNFLPVRRGEYWTADDKGLVHHRDGQSRRFDTASSCLKGNHFRLAGIDSAGLLIVDSRVYRGLGGYATGYLRFGDSACSSIGLDSILGGNMAVMAYARDSKGREYLGAREFAEQPACGPLLRLHQGRIDTLSEEFCGTALAARDEELFAATDSGTFTASGAGALQARTSMLGRPLAGASALFRDSRQVIWIGTFSEEILALAPGGPATDTMRFDAANAGFPDGHATHFAEDSAGNVWVAFSGGQLSIFARDKGALAVRRPPSGLLIPSKSSHGVDALGRRVQSSKGKSRKPLPRRVHYARPNP